jgi:hypothetical protein
MSERALTIATPANMRAFEARNPGRTIPQADGTQVHIEPRRAIALSPSTGEQYSASSGDYWNVPDDEPLRDADGEPMLLVTQHTIYKDAMTGERI